ncbi:MAG: transcriptional repressor [Helicobacteraceae bacterium]|jgi:Fur family peroxide stress response transcriptional regulator|nr:transcriptional repressor [Helicobacteraceae bacterium]
MDSKMILNNGNLKATPQRIKILSLLGDYGHLTIERIYSELKKDTPTISLSTVYSNIESLSEKNIVKEVPISRQKEAYELNSGAHAHHVCRQCGKITDIEIDSAKLGESVKFREEAKIDSVDIIFNGVCNNCHKRVKK